MITFDKGNRKELNSLQKIFEAVSAIHSVIVVAKDKQGVIEHRHIVEHGEKTDKLLSDCHTTLDAISKNVANGVLIGTYVHNHIKGIPGQLVAIKKLMIVLVALLSVLTIVAVWGFLSLSF